MRSAISKYSLLIILASLLSCINHTSEQFTEQEKPQIARHLIEVDYPEKLPETLQKIIQSSGIRHDGYGVLLIIDHSLTQVRADSLRWYFQKQDINAVHAFFVSSKDTLNPIISSAIKNSRFTWAFSNDVGEEVKKLIESIKKTAPETLLVINH